MQIINAQLYMSNSVERYITKAQFYELQKQSENKRVILCGDLGIDDKEFMLTNGVFVYHPLNINTSSKKNKYHRMRFNKFIGRDHVVDYILHTKNLPAPTIKILETELLSDHYPMIANIQL